MHEFIAVDFNLPNHSNDICRAESALEKIRSKYKRLVEKEGISDVEHLYLYEQTIKVLDYVGRLSMYAFRIEDELERLYVMRYPHSPELAKQLWLDHYEHIHHPYNTMKNRCFKQLEELDDLYINVHKKNPKNWNY